ncbi:MAG: HD domain-containing protein [Tannerella sp.]|jgi:CRISPR-associated protein Csm1|nr:HD domain-containing protein [Tannerella sp.]
MENEKQEREHLYLAALLHDIGKFYQRADTGSVSTSKYLSQSNKVESIFLPQYKGIYTHKHCLWTAQFIDNYNAVFKKLAGADSTDLTDKNNLLNLAACHHLQKEQLADLGQIIKEADCLSSGMDRDSAESMKDEQDENSWDSFRKKRMISILETVRLSHDEKDQEKNSKELARKADWMYLPVEKLTLTKSYFPQNKFDAIPNYSQLWDSFISEFKFIQATD